MNKVIINGRLTKSPVLSRTNSGTSVCNARLAANRRIKNGSTFTDKPVFIDITVWGKTAEFVANNAIQGTKLSIEGELDMDEWTDETGQKHSKNKINCEHVEIVSQPKKVVENDIR